MTNKKKITEAEWNRIFSYQYSHGTFRTATEISDWMDKKFEIVEESA